MSNIVAVASSAPELSTLVSAVKSANLVQTLMNVNGVTVFAPTNRAFGKIQVPADNEQLKKVLLNHVFQGVYYAQRLSMMNGQILTALSGLQYSIEVKNGGVCLKWFLQTNGNETSYSSNVIKANIKAGSNLVHEVDAVLL
jgi:transforming growth factor-beta-induced protein